MASISSVEKEVEVKTVVKTNVFNLELSQDEANTLYTILMKIGGSPSDSNRKNAESILHALKGNRSILYDKNSLADREYCEKHNWPTNAIYFKDFNHYTKELTHGTRI